MIETDRALAPYEVDDLEGWVLLDLIGDNATQAAHVERRRLRYAYQLCLTNPVTTGDGEGEQAASWADGIPGLVGYTDTLGGQGTPLVAAFTVEKWATAAGVSHAAAKRTLAATLDLHHRLPKLWARVEELAVPAWKACRVAEDTNHLSLSAATWIDTELERRGTYGLATIDLVIRSAVARFHPDLLRNTGFVDRDDWDVTVDHQAGNGNGTSELTAIGDTVDLEKFSSMITDEATTLGRLGDTDTLGQRKAKALGALADRRATADLLGLIDQPGDSADLVHPDTGAVVTRRRSYLKTRLFVHLTLADLAVMAGHEGYGTSDLVASTNLFGTVHLDHLSTWLRTLGSDARVTPVIDTGRTWSVDQHDPPASMRDQVIVRYPTCVFPGCAVPSRRCDLDHIVAYDPDGPPGQTTPENLAPLCRRHHLAKTHGTWAYARNHDGTHTWRNQHGTTWLVTTHGTTQLTPDIGTSPSPPPPPDTGPPDAGPPDAGPPAQSGHARPDREHPRRRPRAGHPPPGTRTDDPPPF